MGCRRGEKLSIVHDSEMWRTLVALYYSEMNDLRIALELLSDVWIRAERRDQRESQRLLSCQC